MDYQLSPRETQIYTLWQEGKSNKEIAAITKTTVETVRSHKRHLKKKGLHVFDNKKGPGAEHVQIQKDDLPKILSPLEYKIFLEMEQSQKSYQLIAESAGTTEPFVRTAIHRIRQKLGSDFSRFFNKTIELEQPEQCCENCLHNMGKVYNNDTKTIAWQINGQVTCNSNESYFCQSYKRQNRFQEKDLLEEKLNDPGWLKMAYNRYATDVKEPTQSDRMKLAINMVSDMKYILRKRTEQLVTIINGARYNIVAVSSELQSEDVMSYIRHNNVNILKKDQNYEDDKYTIYCKFDNSKKLRQFLNLLADTQDVEIIS